MAARLPACELCRKAKLACDHQQPVCGRCRSIDRASDCLYRATPFKRKRRANSEATAESAWRQVRIEEARIEPASGSPRQTTYPNPGYLGQSSHVAIFRHIAQDADGDVPEANTVDPFLIDDLGLVEPGSRLLSKLTKLGSLDAMADLVHFWTVKGVNLALAGPFVEKIIQSIKQISDLPGEEATHVALSQRLLRHSAKKLDLNGPPSINTYTATIGEMRWETLGLFLCAVCRATIDVPFFSAMYKSDADRIRIQKLAMRLSDSALEICLSLDCLNDLQLVFQYENFVVHSHVDGDQSYDAWRKLGDIISSLFALGYHEDIGTRSRVDPGIVELRKAAFAKIYSADKNVAIFLGRPPRMSKRFCRVEVPLGLLTLSTSKYEWNYPVECNYRTESRYSAWSSMLKEEILELTHEWHEPTKTRKARELEMHAEAQWQALPPRFRELETTRLKELNASPFEHDFLLSIRLNYLHVLFLIHVTKLRDLSSPDDSILRICRAMLFHVVEATLMRDQLVNSGTGLIWKIAHYGLPAAGILVLSLLNLSRVDPQNNMSRKQTIDDLRLLVAEISRGSVVRASDPSFPLFRQAARTIQAFLSSQESELAHKQSASTEPPRGNNDEIGLSEGWAAFLNEDRFDFEEGFWENLADHPFLNPASLLQQENA